jgi:non-specific serine/threonine protein kinase
VLLAELGRARCAYPELSAALGEPAPTAVEVDLAGAYRFLSEVAPTLEVAGFGVLLPAWWRHPSSRLGLRLRARPQSSRGSAGRAGNALLSGDGLATVNWRPEAHHGRAHRAGPPEGPPRASTRQMGRTPAR